MQNNNEPYIGFFRALANDERIEIIKLLKKNDEMSAQEVERHFYLEQSTTSHHLNTLRRVGVLEARKEGRNVYYTVNKEKLKVLLDRFIPFCFG